MTCEKVILKSLTDKQVYKQQEIEFLVQEKCKQLEINTFKDVQRTVRKLCREGKYFQKSDTRGFYFFDSNINIQLEKGAFFSEDVKKKVFERDGNVCQLCGFEYNKKELLIDHITPYDKNGNGDIENAQVCCINCNNKKRNKQNEEVLIENYYKQLEALKVLEKNIYSK